MKIFNKIMVINLLLLVFLYVLIAYMPLPFPKLYGYATIGMLSIIFMANMWYRLIKGLART